VATSAELEDAFVDLARTASRVLTRGRVLVEEDENGSHHAIGLEVPIEVVRELADAVQEARAILRDQAARRAA
jgi:hypothetical protein